jgi:hypothetical protein
MFSSDEGSCRRQSSRDSGEPPLIAGILEPSLVQAQMAMSAICHAMIAPQSLLPGLHPAFDNIHSWALGTILSRADWLTDTITFGEML